MKSEKSLQYAFCLPVFDYRCLNGENNRANNSCRTKRKSLRRIAYRGGEKKGWRIYAIYFQSSVDFKTLIRITKLDFWSVNYRRRSTAVQLAENFSFFGIPFHLDVFGGDPRTSFTSRPRSVHTGRLIYFVRVLYL